MSHLCATLPIPKQYGLTLELALHSSRSCGAAAASASPSSSSSSSSAAAAPLPLETLRRPPKQDAAPRQNALRRSRTTTRNSAPVPPRRCSGPTLSSLSNSIATRRSSSSSQCNSHTRSIYTPCNTARQSSNAARNASTQIPSLSDPSQGFATSAHQQAPPSLDSSSSSPITLATPSKATADLLAWWHRTVRFSTARPPRAAEGGSIQPSLRPSPNPLSPPSARPRTDANGPQGAADADQEAALFQNPATDINHFMRHPSLLSHVNPPKHPIVLCHGLYGFDVRGPFFGLEIHYWAAVLDILRKKIGADVIVRGVPATGSIASRAKALHQFLCSEEAGVRGQRLNFVGHSMGGLDARYLISHLKPTPDEYTPISCTTISTPHRGSPFMDWCNANVGIGREYVDELIREYEGQKGTFQAHRETSTAEATESEGEKLPYSLKSPLFVRPKKTGSDGTGKAGDVKKTKEEAAAAAQIAAEGKGTEDAQAKEKSQIDQGLSSKLQEALTSSPDLPGGQGKKSTSSFKSLSSLEFVSPLTKALSSLGGLFSSYMLSVLDQPAYAMLSTRFMAKVFNPSTPDSPRVEYFSIAARTRKIPLWHPLWLPKVILDAAAESRTVGSERDGSAAALGNPELQGNDGLVSVQSAKWGRFLGVVEDKDHWDLRGGGAPRWGSGGKTNPSTGKPFRDANGKGDADVKSKEKSEDGWLNINRLLGSWIGSSKSGNEAGAGATKQQQQQQPVSASEAAQSSSDAEPARKSEEDQSSVASTINSTLSSAEETAQAFLENYASLTAPDESTVATGVSKSAAADASASATAPPPASTAGADQQPSGAVDGSALIDEVASWISDRLPQGSEERRKLADETAQQQEAGIVPLPLALGQPVEGSASASAAAAAAAAAAQSQSQSQSQPAWSGSDVSFQYDAELSGSDSDSSDGKDPAPLRLTFASEPTLGSIAAVPHASASRLVVPTGGGGPPAAPADVSRYPPTMYGREDAAHGVAARARASAPSSASSADAAPGDSLKEREALAADAEAVQKRKEKEREKKEKERSDKEELERFWVAVCLHLRAHGF